MTDERARALDDVLGLMRWLERGDDTADRAWQELRTSIEAMRRGATP